MAKELMYDSPDPNKRRIIGYICDKTGNWVFTDEKALAGSIKYDSPETSRPCPKNFKSANGRKVCIWENPNLSKTPILDSLTATEFPSPQVPITKSKSRLDRIPSLTELLGGPI